MYRVFLLLVLENTSCTNYLSLDMTGITENLFLKVIITLFCTGGLTYHTFQLFNEYMRGKSVVRIEVGRVLNDTLPSITICYPYFISFEKLSKIDQDYYTEYEKYLDILKKIKAAEN